MHKWSATVWMLEKPENKPTFKLKCHTSPQWPCPPPMWGLFFLIFWCKKSNSSSKIPSPPSLYHLANCFQSSVFRAYFFPSRGSCARSEDPSPPLPLASRGGILLRLPLLILFYLFFPFIFLARIQICCLWPLHGIGLPFLCVSDAINCNFKKKRKKVEICKRISVHQTDHSLPLQNKPMRRCG